MFKIFVGEEEAPKKNPKGQKSLLPLEIKVAKKNPHDEKVAIAPPPWAPAGGGARVGGRPTPPPTGKLKNVLLFLYVEAFSATFMGWGAFSHLPHPLQKFLRAPKAPPHSHL